MNCQSMDYLLTTLKGHKEDLEPLKRREILKIQHLAGAPLPEVYLTFLREMGRGAGDFMAGSSVFVDEIFLLKEWAEELIEENGLPNLPEDSFVFWFHQGYQMAFFILGESNDPKVYFFGEGRDQTEFVEIGNLSSFFIKQLEHYKV